MVGGDVGGRVVVVVEEAVVVEIDIFTVDSGFFDTSLKILTPAPHVVHVTNIRYESLHTSAFKVWFVVQMFYIEWFQYLTPNVFEYLISHLQRSDVVWPLCVLACQLDRANTGALSMMMMMMLLMINQC